MYVFIIPGLGSSGVVNGYVHQFVNGYVVFVVVEKISRVFVILGISLLRRSLWIKKWRNMGIKVDIIFCESIYHAKT